MPPRSQGKASRSDGAARGQVRSRPTSQPPAANTRVAFTGRRGRALMIIHGECTRPMLVVHSAALDALHSSQPCWKRSAWWPDEWCIWCRLRITDPAAARFPLSVALAQRQKGSLSHFLDYLLPAGVRALSLCSALRPSSAPCMQKHALTTATDAAYPFVGFVGLPDLP